MPAAKIANELPIRAFESSPDWAAWLARNHGKSASVWLRFFKKTSGVPSITYAEALDEAHCYGWIDGQLKKFDDKSWLRKFTPRRARSLWSKKNVAHAERLIKAGRMTAAGLKEIEAAKSDGRWGNAYDSPSTMEASPDFLKELSKDPKAYAFYKTLNRANTYAIAWRLQTAKKPETRERRMRTILEMLRKGKKWH